MFCSYRHGDCDICRQVCAVLMQSKVCATDRYEAQSSVIVIVRYSPLYRKIFQMELRGYVYRMKE